MIRALIGAARSGFVLAVAVVAAGAQPPAAQRIDSLFRAGAVESYAAATIYVAQAPDDYGALWRAARAEVMRGILSHDTGAEKGKIYLLAEGHARRAIMRSPDQAEGHYWLAAALGLRSAVEGMRTAARISSEAHAEALRTLAIDSLHAGAHALLGKMHSDVSRLSPLTRFVASRLLGIVAVRSASWEGAERELTKAIALDPGCALYRSDLVQLYIRTGRGADAGRALTALLALPIRTPVDTAIMCDAKGKLANFRAGT